MSAMARPVVYLHRPAMRTFSRSARAAFGSSVGNEGCDIAELLQQPTWSVASLLVERNSASHETYDVTIDKLRHLLRLSALPFPTNPEEQTAMINTLRTQLHFVRDVQRIGTTGLEPLQAIRDETQEGVKQYTIGIKDVEQALLQEESYGHNGRPRRPKGKAGADDTEDWDSLATAARKAGRYIVVNGAEQ